jgi:multidrug efflux pump
MKLSEICIKRPVLAWVLTFVIIVLGVIAGMKLPLERYPKVSTPYITIETHLPGAGPDIVETQVTKIIEDAIAGLEGLDVITSNSNAEESKVMLQFNPERDIADAINDVRDRLSKCRDNMPKEITEPTLTKSKAEDRPVLTLAMTSSTKKPDELYDFARRELEKELEGASGVGRVELSGGSEKQMKIHLNPELMNAYQISVKEVTDALERQNFEKPAGYIMSKNRQYVITTKASLDQPEEFNQIAITTRNKTPIYIKDIGWAEISTQNQKTSSLFNGQRGISIGIIKQANANPISVSEEINKKLTELKKSLPSDIQIHVASDNTKHIKRSLEQVKKTIYEAIILVILVVFLFLRSARASLIPLVTIPVSLIGVLALMAVLNFSINILTLMAMVLAIGLVVDDAIVVLENVHRYIEKGEKPFVAAFKGIREISFAVVAMTLTLAAVYTPIIFAEGVIGKMLTEFSITLAGAVVLSGFVALTLSPMMCARLLKGHGEEDHLSSHWWRKFKEKIPSDVFLLFLEKKYEHFLNIAIKKRFLVSLIGVSISGVGYGFYSYLPKELEPKEDKGSIGIEGYAPNNATLEFTQRYVNKVDNFLAQFPDDIETRITTINNPSFDIGIQLKSDRKRSTEEMTQLIEEKLNEITGISGRIRQSSSSDDGGQKISLAVLGNQTQKEIGNVITGIISPAMRKSNLFSTVLSMSQQDSPRFIVNVMRDKLAMLNIDPYSVAITIHSLVRGAKAKTYTDNGRTYDVWVEVENEARQSPQDIYNLFVKANDKEQTLVPLAELVNVTSEPGPIEIFRYNKMRAVTVSAPLKPGHSMDEGIALIEKIRPQLEDTECRIEFIDDTKRFLKEGKTILLIFSLSLLFIYLVMAAQFESWRDPFIIILSVPLSLTGAVLTLALIKDGSINIFSNIGMITLIGLITKHGILMVDFANKLREKDKLSPKNAIIKASSMRLRPILMTTFAMVLGALPLTFSFGEGFEARRQLGWVIVGGMSIGTIFTLFIIPSFYIFFSKKDRSFELLNTEFQAL